MNRNRRRRQPLPKGQPGPSRALVLERTANLVRAELRRYELDFAPAATLAPLLGVTNATLREAVERQPDLGICGHVGHPMIWALPPGPLTAGFAPVVVARRLVLALGGSAANPHTLVLSGRSLGPADADSTAPDGDSWGGELGHTISRLCRMAERWLLLDQTAETATDRCRQLFELIVSTWRAGPAVQQPGGRLEIYQAEHPTPIATRFWDDGGSTAQLELVVWTDNAGQHQLVNVHPGGAHCMVLEQEDCG